MVSEPAVRGGAQTSSRLDDALESIIATDVIVPDLGKVRRYLLAHGDMVELTVRVCALVRERFRQTTVHLEVNEDPEIADAYLAVAVGKAGHPEITTDMIHDTWPLYWDEMSGKSGTVQVF